MKVFQPTGSWWQAWDYDGAGRWHTAASPAGTFTYQYPGDATTEPGGNWITNRYDARGRLTETALRNSGGTLLNLHGYAYDDAIETFGVNALNELTSIPGSTPTYARRGNLIQRGFSSCYW